MSKNTDSERNLKRSRSGKIAGIVFFACAGALIYILCRVLFSSSVHDGLIPMSILFGSFSAAFLLSGIFTFSCKVFIKKVVITFFVCTLFAIIGSIAAAAITVRM